MLSLGAPVDTKPCSALAWAICRGNTTSSRLLLAAGASLQRCFNDFRDLVIPRFRYGGVTHVAARSAFILELCADPSLGLRSLDAVRLGVIFSIPALVALHLKGAEADESNLDWQKLRRYANWRSPDGKAVLLLLAARPALFEFDWFDIAADLGDQQLDRELCALNPDFDENEALFAACGVGDLELVKSLLARDGHAHGDIVLSFVGRLPSYHFERTPLLVASQNGHVDVVRYALCWLRSKPDRGVPSESLMAAVGSGLLQEALELIRDGVDINERPPGLVDLYESPISVACDCLNVDMVRMLLDEGADPNLTFDGHPPLFLAASDALGRTWRAGPTLSVEERQARRDAMVRLLLAAGAALDSDPEVLCDRLVEDYADVRALVARLTAAGVSGSTGLPREHAQQ